MKKLFLVMAFSAFTGSVVLANVADDKDKGKKDETKKETKACCKDKSASGKACSGMSAGEKKACCKDKTAKAETKTETSEAKAEK
jgi:hypothetical protein